MVTLTPVDYDPFSGTAEANPEARGVTEELLVRQPGRFGRQLATGTAALLDIPRIVTDPLYTAGYYGAKALDAPETQEFFRKELERPTYAQKTQAAIDEATGGYLQPQSELEKGVDVINEIAAGVVAPTAITKGAQAVKSLATKPKLPSVDDIKAASQAAYDRALSSGITFENDLTDTILKSTQKHLPKTKAQKSILAGSPAANQSAVLQKLKGQKLTIEDVDLLDKRLTDNIFKLQVSEPAEARKLSMIQDDLREAISKYPVSKDLAEARNLWAQQSKIKDIESLIENASMTDNPSKSIQTAFRTLLRNKKRMSGYTDAERKMIQKAAKTGLVVDALRIAGSRLNTIAVAAGTGNIPAAAATFGAGSISQKAALQLQRGKGENVIRQIAGRPVGGTGIAAQSITGAEVTPAMSILGGISPIQEGVESNPTKITVNPAAEGTEGLPDVELPEGISLMPVEGNPFDVQLPESIPDQSSLTQQNEGIRLSTYTDTEGNPTIGYGFNFNSGIASKVWKQAGLVKDIKAVKAGRESLDPAEAQALYHASYQVADNDARQYYKDFDNLTPVQQEALRDMSYQFGLPNLQKMKSLHSALQKGDKNAIVQAIRNSDYGKKFTERAREVTNMLISEQAYAQDLTPQQRGFLKAKGLL